ncbi:MAG: hypothetical protein INR71_08155 [Terriglobus roseus]|nr:hypothetical protein [Terriglobus roseus]
MPADTEDSSSRSSNSSAPSSGRRCRREPQQHEQQWQHLEKQVSEGPSPTTYSILEGLEYSHYDERG